MLNRSSSEKNLASDTDTTSFMHLSELPIQHIGSFLPHKDKASYARTCKTVHTFFQPDLDESMLKDLLEAVVNDGKLFIFDDKKIMQKILDNRPDLLLGKPRKSTTIEKMISFSQGMQKFHANETPFLTALILGHLEMIKLMLPYLEKIENGREKALLEWNPIKTSKEKQNVYANMIRKLIEIISQEKREIPLDQTNAAKKINELIKQLNSDVYLTLDKYFDPLQLLIAGYQANHNSLNTPFQKNIYCHCLAIIKNSLPQEIRQFFIEKNAIQNAYEVFNNKKLCDNFILFIEQRQKQLQQYKEILSLETFYKIYQEEYLPLGLTK